VTTTVPVLPILALVAALVAAALFAAAWWIARDTGLTAGARVVSTDVGAEPATMLTDDTLGIRGRPDYLVRETEGLVPIEIKPMRKARTLYESDRVQIGAYMLLVRAAHPDTFAGYGRVRYREATFVVPLTPELEARCAATATAVRAARRARDVHRTHTIAAKCRACAMRPACTEALPAVG
jgi:CRISPR/Cas system-associated exonuclease Cas4 (RecB family)